MDLTSPVAVPRDRNTAIAPEDEASITVLIQAFERIWNEHEICKLEALFTPDADWINIVGMWWRGRAQIIRALDTFHRSIFRSHNMRLVDVDIRMITSEVAIATETQSTDAFKTPDGNEIREGLNRLTFVLTKRDGSWLIASGHNTVIDMDAQRNNPIQFSPLGITGY